MLVKRKHEATYYNSDAHAYFNYIKTKTYSYKSLREKLKYRSVKGSSKINLLEQKSKIGQFV